MANEFKWRKESSLLGHTVEIWELKATTSLRPFTVEASPFGVGVRGDKALLLESMEDLQDFAKVISDAWKVHMKLKPRIEIVKGRLP